MNRKKNTKQVSARAALTCCTLCPRECRVNRTAGQRGFCRAGEDAVVYRYGPHHGEEPPISGTRGSGTIFFSHCTLACIYCQNYPWSQEGQGTEYDEAALVGVFVKLAEAGCHNWNLVSPTPWLPRIFPALETAKGHGHDLPVVYNTSGFEKVATLKLIADWVDLFLVDLRYADPRSASEGSKAADYVTVAREAIATMWRLAGPLRVDSDGMARSGVICRLLLLPGRAQEAIANLHWLAETIGTDVSISLMSQYIPLYRAASEDLAGWNCRVTREEYDEVCVVVERLGFDKGWIQDFEGDAAPELLGYQMEACVGP